MERPAAKAVLFDLDDTLYDREGAFRQWTQSFVRARFPNSVSEQQNAMAESIIAQDAGGYGSKAAIFERLSAAFPEQSAQSKSSASEFYDQFFAYINLSQETRLLLDNLKAASLPFGIVTNGSARQWRKITHLGLDLCTSCLFVSETFGSQKPDAKIFLAAAAHLGAEPASILFVGDHPVNDIAGAARAGMQTAWLHCGKPWPEEIDDVRPDYILDSLGDLRSILLPYSR